MTSRGGKTLESQTVPWCGGVPRDTQRQNARAPPGDPSKPQQQITDISLPGLGTRLGWGLGGAGTAGSPGHSWALSRRPHSAAAAPRLRAAGAPPRDGTVGLGEVCRNATCLGRGRAPRAAPAVRRPADGARVMGASDSRRGRRQGVQMGAGNRLSPGTQAPLLPGRGRPAWRQGSGAGILSPSRGVGSDRRWRTPHPSTGAATVFTSPSGELLLGGPRAPARFQSSPHLHPRFPS